MAKYFLAEVETQPMRGLSRRFGTKPTAVEWGRSFLAANNDIKGPCLVFEFGKRDNDDGKLVCAVVRVGAEIKTLSGKNQLKDF